MLDKPCFIGIDVGSTTVKAVVVQDNPIKIIWQKYLRHETRQAEFVLSMLEEIHDTLPDLAQLSPRVFVTGSGAGPLLSVLGANFVQEVNAVTFAVEHLHPDVNSVIELGGQDAKIIIFKENPQTGEKRAITSMNDKCASGTGATIDKCVIKSGITQDALSKLVFNPEKLHHVAAKCGVFAETDIVNLVKSGIPADEIMNSLADAIVSQNLSVLTRGNTLSANVLLLGGPNTYLPFLKACWRYRIPQTWAERGYESPNKPIDDLIFAPDNAEYYAAFGAVLYGRLEKKVTPFLGMAPLRDFILTGRKDKLGDSAGPALSLNDKATQDFVRQYTPPSFDPESVSEKNLSEKNVVTNSPVTNSEIALPLQGYIGLDGGSTSSKCVLVNQDGTILQKVYQLSKGNPLEDMKSMFLSLKAWASEQGRQLDIQGFGVTGYAGDVMETALNADANIVETIAHMKSAQHFFPNVDVICDVGGQDIKVLFMENKVIKNFRLSNSCSAGNGMLLQAMADQFGIPVEQYSEKAFQASLSPTFSYGCAVFLDSDRVNFQKEGYNSEELLAGLALVLPKNIWQYVVQIPRMAELGRVFVLQGGTQKNLAAVKAQVDYIQERVPDAEVHVHPHTGEAGALGAAYEAIRVVNRRGYSTFIGLEASIHLDYKTRNDESTRCDFCPNNCSRTFIDAITPEKSVARYISGFSCEKGTVEDLDALKILNADRRQRMKAYPNLVDYEARWTFKSYYKPKVLPNADTPIQDIAVKNTWLGGVKHKPYIRGFKRSAAEQQEYRKKIRIGIPKGLNIWSTAPFWRAYFETLGIKPGNIIFSDDSSEELWQAGGKYGSIDPCYPAKVVQAHIHNLLFQHHEKTPLNYVFFPSITHIPTFVENTQDTACCPIVAGTPNVMGATFTKDVDFFAQRNIQYLDPAVSLNEPLLLKKRLFETFESRLAVTEDENNFAVDQAFEALHHFDQHMQDKGREILNHITAENRVALLMIGRPYHNDPGMNHSVLEEYQAMGYPILSMKSLPKDPEYLKPFFQDDLDKGFVESPLEIHDIWPENYSVNSVQKVWATKFAARHPNIAVLDLSSFKCGHDAPTYGLIDRIIAASNTPYSALHDIDANKPSGSIKIRVKTFGYTLNLAQESLEDEANTQNAFNVQLLKKRIELLEYAPDAVKKEPTYLQALHEAHENLRLNTEQNKASLSSIAPLEASTETHLDNNQIPVLHIDD